MQKCYDKCKCSDWVLTTVLEFDDASPESNMILFIGDEQACIDFADGMTADIADQHCNKHAEQYPFQKVRNKYFMMYPASDFKEMFAKPYMN